MHIYSPVAKIYLQFILLFISYVCFSQTKTLTGQITNEKNEPVSSVNIFLVAQPSIGTFSDTLGNFKLSLPQDTHLIRFQHTEYIPKEIKVQISSTLNPTLNVILLPSQKELEPVVVTSEKEPDFIDPSTKINVKSAQNLPSAFGDFSKVLLTLPGVAGNNELSSAYNVRGGNFDENLVYVNDIPVYRPFLSNMGRQEGLSFINSDLVRRIRFYSGGWYAKYGDKLSSSLNIEYKESEKLEGKLTLGLLGGSAYVGDRISDRIQYLVGARYRDSRYLLRTLDTKGQYFPNYLDLQAFVTFDLSKKSNSLYKTKLNWLISYARNRYLTLPTSQVTDFGTFFQTIRLNTAFTGSDELKYNTFQSGINLSHLWNESVLSRLIVSGVSASESELFTIEGAYNICDIERDQNSDNVNNCAVLIGSGTNYSSGRNLLQATIFSAELRNEILLSDFLKLEVGSGLTSNYINDQINEYSFLDSAGFVVNPYDPNKKLISSIFNQLDIHTLSFINYLQSSYISVDSVHNLNVGVRVNYLNYNNQWLISPRAAYRFKPKSSKRTAFKISLGKYSQPPFYRELRDLDGNIKQQVKAQQSLHTILSVDHLFNWKKRPFLVTAEAYYKRLTDVIPYDIDNLRLRYFAENNARAYAYGMDVRINGEFIEDIESWFSLGLLYTKEDIDNDMKGYIRRPTDQHINLAFYFEDSQSFDPTMKVYVNGVFGSGYPTGPPNSLETRNIFSGDEYYRLDIGFSKSFQLRTSKYFKSIIFRAEVLNVLGANNTLSYTWIQTVNGSQLAVPNALSARFLNLKATIEI